MTEEIKQLKLISRLEQMSIDIDNLTHEHSRPNQIRSCDLAKTMIDDLQHALEELGLPIFTDKRRRIKAIIAAKEAADELRAHHYDI